MGSNQACYKNHPFPNSSKNNRKIVLLNNNHHADRFLISFSGKYLAYDYCHESAHVQSKGGTECNFDHQLYRIHVPHTEANDFGPVFIEVGAYIYFVLLVFHHNSSVSHNFC